MKKLLTAALIVAIAGVTLAIDGIALAADEPKSDAPKADAPKPDAPKKQMPAAKKPAAGASSKEKLLNPAALTETAPETYKAKFETSKGDFVIAVTRAWSPNGADRFYNLVK